ncbi:MAG: hypothetical protein MAG795_00167 [Candidatus Woesearchaeota archaeon]|nr:hypothetical protein [Candidatus Woesearchaeota archaeon]
MANFSNSRINTFQQCKLRYKYQYIDRIKTEIETSIEAFMGDMVHQALEKLYKDVKFKKTVSLQELLDFYQKLWDDNWREGIEIVRKEYSAENYKQMGIGFIRDYYKRKKPFNRTKTLGLETVNLAEIAPGIKYHIRIDRLALDGDTYEIHDYKTSNSLPTQEKVNQDKQLTLYTYGLRKMYPDAKKVKQIWHYLAFDKDIVLERTDGEIEKARLEVLEIIKEIGKCKKWPAKASALCGWCQFKPICPKFKHKYDIKEKSPQELSQDKGVNLVDEYVKISEKIKKLEIKKDKLKQSLVHYSDKKNIEVVYGTDMRATVKTYPRLSFPKKNDSNRKDFFKTLKLVGLWDKLATADVYQLAKMINSHKVSSDIVDLLDEYISKSKIHRVYLGKRYNK